MSNDYMSTKDAARALGYTVQHTRLLIREGKLQAEKLGRDWLVLKEAVGQYNASGSSPASSGQEARDAKAETQLHCEGSLDGSNH